jgi:serine kinase of HPr protein (carbohydrate metabolism regulator)
MDVLGLGVLITGESGVARATRLELISLGHGLVADDVVTISHRGQRSKAAARRAEGLHRVRGLGAASIPHHLATRCAAG